MQVVQWCRRISQHAKNEMWQSRDAMQPVICRTHFLSRFHLRANWELRFGPSTRTQWSVGTNRYPTIFEVIDMLLGVYGAVVRPGKAVAEGAKRQRPAAAAGRQIFGCPTLLSVDAVARCSRCTQIRP